MRIIALIILIQTAFTGVKAQEQAFLKMVQPVRTEINTSSAKQYMSGRTCAGCKVTLNGDTIHVYPTGVFALKRIIKPGKTSFTLSTTDTAGKKVSRTYNYYYTTLPPVRATSVFRIDDIKVFPRGNSTLSPGDTIRVRIKGYPGCKAYWMHETPLYELPSSKYGAAGFYEGMYVIQESDSLLDNKVAVFLKHKNGNTGVLQSSNKLTYQRNQLLAGRTVDRNTYLTIAPDGDRLGPVKIGYLDQDVLLHITGKQGNYFKVKLSNQQTAFIPELLLDTQTLSAPTPLNIVEETRTWSDARYDYISVGLSERLPYLSTQQVDPGKITLDIHGANLEPDCTPISDSMQEVKGIKWEQIGSDVLRVNISLKHKQPWGYKVYYDSTRLVIAVKHIPTSFQLKNLTLGLDPGHGGTNVGALGAAGYYEKQLTLMISLLLKTALEKEGAKVLMTRTTDQYVPNEERLSYYRQMNPDLLISIHLNSSVNPVDVHGTANYYKHPFCEPFNRAIHAQLLGLGLSDFGNNGDFNFILNNPTEFPDALIETLFLSNPEDEMNVLDEGFRQKMVDRIMAGIKDFLREAELDKVTRKVAEQAATPGSSEESPGSEQ